MHQQIIKKTNLVVILPSPTRWGYSFLVLERSFKIKNALKDIKDPEDLPSDQEWSELNVLKNLYGICYDYLKKFQGSNYVTYSVVYPSIKSLVENFGTDNVSLNIKTIC